MDRWLFAIVAVLLMTLLCVSLANNCGSGAEHSLCREWPGYDSPLTVKPI